MVRQFMLQLTLYLHAVKPGHGACFSFLFRSSRLSVFGVPVCRPPAVCTRGPTGPLGSGQPLHDTLPTPSSSSLPGSTSMSHGGHHVCSAALNIFFYERDMYILKPRANTKTKEEWRILVLHGAAFLEVMLHQPIPLFNPLWRLSLFNFEVLQKMAHIGWFSDLQHKIFLWRDGHMRLASLRPTNMPLSGAGNLQWAPRQNCACSLQAGLKKTFAVSTLLVCSCVSLKKRKWMLVLG